MRRSRVRIPGAAPVFSLVRGTFPKRNTNSLTGHLAVCHGFATVRIADAEPVHAVQRGGTVSRVKAATTPLPVADLGDEYWGIEHIGAALRLRNSAVCARVRAAGFPAPVFGTQRYRRWRAEEVRRYLSLQGSTRGATPATRIDPDRPLAHTRRELR